MRPSIHPRQSGISKTLANIRPYDEFMSGNERVKMGSLTINILCLN